MLLCGSIGVILVVFLIDVGDGSVECSNAHAVMLR